MEKTIKPKHLGSKSVARKERGVKFEKPSTSVPKKRNGKQKLKENSNETKSFKQKNTKNGEKPRKPKTIKNMKNDSVKKKLNKKGQTTKKSNLKKKATKTKSRSVKSKKKITKKKQNQSFQSTKKKFAVSSKHLQDILNLKKDNKLLELQNAILSENLFKQNYLLKKNNLDLHSKQGHNDNTNNYFKYKFDAAKRMLYEKEKQIESLKTILEDKNKENCQINKINLMHQEKILKLIQKFNQVQKRNENLKNIIDGLQP